LTVSARITPSHFPVQRILIALGVLVGVLALAPVIAGITNAVLSDAGPRTAFASAPAGEYIVFSGAAETTDTILVAPASDPSAATVIAEIDHLDGFTTRGAVSPSGRLLALVAADAGTVAAPGASLLVLELETGAVTRMATAVDYLQTPLWTPDSTGIVVVQGADSGKLSILHVPALDGDLTELQRFEGVLGVYPVGFDPEGRLVTVVIDGSGSTIYRDGGALRSLGSSITRDWQLSPDGTQLAYIETNVDDGLQYIPRLVSLVPGLVEAQSVASLNGQALGVAWAPGAQAPVFGVEPAATSSGSVAAQSLAGFDIPVGYSPTGRSLIVQRWTGSSFADAGDASFEVVSESGRATLPGASRILGWAAR
jgi:hypothetical protein